METTKRAVTYARVSGDDRGNEGRNLSGQLAMCKEYAVTKGYAVIAELAEDDRGASGASFELPQLGKVLELSRDRAFDVLIVREIDRLSRKLAKQLIVEEWLKREGVGIEYVLGEYPDTPEGNLMKHVRAVVAEYEREKIRERMLRGKRLKVKAGSVMTNGFASPPYGYKVIMVGNNYQLEVYESEAQIVRMIYDWYVHGDENGEPLSMGRITERLSNMKLPTRLDTNRKGGGRKKRGYGEWNRGQVENILRSTTYRGVWTYGRKNDPIAVNVPVIVDLETWQAAHERRQHTRLSSVTYRKGMYLLSGHMRCGQCGASFNGQAHTVRGVRYPRYHCGANHKSSQAHRCHMPSYDAVKVDAAVWDWLIDVLTDPKRLEQGVNARLAQDEKELLPLKKRRSICQDMLEDCQHQLARLVDLYIMGEFSKDILADRKSRLEKSIEALESEMVGITSALERATLTPQQIENIHDFAREVSKGIETAQNNSAYQRQLIETLNVQVTFAMEGDEKVFYTKCVLDMEQMLWVLPRATRGN